jgi:anti-sigma B factor antagonist
MNYKRTDNENGTLLRIEGELDALTAPELREHFDALVSEGRTPITLDLSSLRLLDSSGVGAIVSLYKRVRANGGSMRVVNACEQPAAIFRLLRLDAVFGDQG